MDRDDITKESSSRKREHARSPKRDRDRDRDRSRDRKRGRSSRSRSPRRDRSRERSRERKRERKDKRDRSRSRSRDRGTWEKRDDRRDQKDNVREDSIIKSDAKKSLSSLQKPLNPSTWAADREAQKELEQIQIEEEIRKRKERVKAWQEEKARQALADTNFSSERITDIESTAAEGPDGINVESADEANAVQHKGWSLEDDDDEDNEEALIANKIDAAESKVDNAEVVIIPIVKVDTEEEPVFDQSIKQRRLSISSTKDEEKHAEIKKNITNDRLPHPTIAVLPVSTAEAEDFDPLDAFMSSLYSSGQVESQRELKSLSKIETGKIASMPAVSGGELSEDEDEYTFYSGAGKVNPFGSNFITLEDLMSSNFEKSDNPKKVYEGWESDAGTLSPNHVDEDKLKADEETEEERELREERERLEFMEAIRKARAIEEEEAQKYIDLGEQLNRNEEAPVSQSVQKMDNFGRIFAGEGDVAEESEAEIAKKKSALELIEEAKRGRELKPVDHSSIEYIPFRKNIYVVPKALAKLTDEEVKEKRDELSIVVRGKGCPSPVESWEQCGLSDRILETLDRHKLVSPFAIQRQAIPAIMCGRDIIGVAKTGSGKTLAFLLPMIRHIQDQPPLKEGEGPIGLIMAPARELALQIRTEAKKFTRTLNMQVACIYGGAGVAEQIAELKRGSEIVVCTPGRMIELLCMQTGKMISLRRVSMVVLDEADRMFDMGFEPQIKMITQNIRPDRQTLLFSATFPKQIEKLARAMLKFPLEIIVGERSSVNKDITQIVEVHEEEDKYLRLLQLLGLLFEQGSILIFVDTQEKCDALYSDLLKSGYPCLSLHGGKDQVDRDFTIHQFKQGIFNVLVATSVAGRGLDVPDIICVINYNCPNHLEDYVHRVGRTGRAGRKGVAYTFISSKEEQYSPIMIKALEKAGITPAPELIILAEQFKEKVARGEAHYSGSGFVGKGFKFDASEMNEQQKVASMQRRQYELENGLIEEEDDVIVDEDDFDAANVDLEASSATSAVTSTTAGALTSSTETATSGPPAQILPFAANMTPIERARALAANLPLAGSVGLVSGTSITGSTSQQPVDAKAALSKALLIAKQIAGSSKDNSSTSHFLDELEINDYPPQARRKINTKKVLDEIIDRTGVSVIFKGTYIAPGKKAEIGDRKLYVHITGESEMGVKQAKLEIQRVLDEETLRIGATPTASTGRYSVV